MAKQRSTRLGWITVALLAAVFITGAVTAKERKEPKAPAGSGPLDGMAFVGEVGRDGKDRGRSDKFVFSDGKFRASSFSAYGFSGAAYESTSVEGELTFTVAVVSKRSSGGTMHWNGTLRGDVLEGTMRWDHGWESKHYWFRGRTKAKKTASR